MRSFAVLLMLGFTATSVLAAEGTCSSNAAAKKLAGAAKTSFMTKCMRDAQTKCDTDAATKKLNGAAKTSFTKKCVTDSVGT